MNPYDEVLRNPGGAYLNATSLREGWTLRARVTHQATIVADPKTKLTVEAATDWRVMSFNFDEATLAPLVGNGPRIRLLTLEPAFSEHWELVGT